MTVFDNNDDRSKANTRRNDGDQMIFGDGTQIQSEQIEPLTTAPWKLLIVDDEPAVHQTTELALQRLIFAEKPLTFLSAYSGAEAKQIMSIEPDTAVILLDIVMETNEAGLEVVRYIREVLDNQFVQIILRTGQPGDTPEEQIILEYAINAYKAKTDLTRQKLYTTIISALRSFRNVRQLAEQAALLQDLNTQLQQEIRERKKLEAVRLERERLRLKNLYLKAQSDELAKLNADKDKFFSIVAHDLKGPFNGFLGLCEMYPWLIDQNDPAEMKEIALNMLESAKNVYTLLENLLDWSRLQRKQLKPQETTFKLIDIVNRNRELSKSTATQKDIALELRVSDHLQARADRYMVDTIVRNLISNALKFTEKGGRITITARPLVAAERVEISVADTGVGISPADLDKLFRIETNYSTKGTADEPGTGLGLIICKEMAEKQSGRLWVESQLGIGTTVRFTVPLDFED